MASTRLQVTFNKPAYVALKDIAAQEGRAMSDVVRDAVDEYAKARGYEIDTNVQRGGVRPKKTDQNAD